MSQNSELELFRDSEPGISVTASGSHRPVNGWGWGPTQIAEGVLFQSQSEHP